jgi:hypothetical protein
LLEPELHEYVYIFEFCTIYISPVKGIAAGVASFYLPGSGAGSGAGFGARSGAVVEES